jgi:uncharacterized protein (DUF305 family)
MPQQLQLVRACVFAALLVGACQGNERPAMSMAEIKIPPGANYTAADVRFMQGMIYHHAQALKMAAMAPTHGAGPSVQLLCKKITVSQKDEIAMMSTWLKDRNQAVPDPNDPHPMMMPGMLTDAQLAALDKARDSTFDRLFLTGMIQHHQGAIQMVKDLFATPGAGQAGEIFRFASDVDTDQRGEIARMQAMLESPTHTFPAHTQ